MANMTKKKMSPRTSRKTAVPGRRPPSTGLGPSVLLVCAPFIATASRSCRRRFPRSSGRSGRCRRTKSQHRGVREVAYIRSFCVICCARGQAYNSVDDPRGHTEIGRWMMASCTKQGARPQRQLPLEQALSWRPTPKINESDL